jgi:predicted transcriptional regulator
MPTLNKMISKRSKEQIIVQILEICREDASKSKIVYAAGMNFGSINVYLDLLLRQGLLESCFDIPVLYKITNKGIKTLAHLKAIEELIPDQMQ